MGLNQINLDMELIEKIRTVAVKNKLKTNNQSLVDLSLSIATSVIKHLDDESFEQITSFKL
jgi:hypothetical protein